MFKFITHRPLWLNILAGLLLAVAVFFLFVSSLNFLTRHGSSRTVPQVTGKSYDEAKKILTSKGFNVIIQDSVYTDTLKPFQVLRQIPDGDAIVKVNRDVYLVINRKVPPEISMPNLVGFSKRNAEMILKNNGLKLGDTTFKPDFARNSVLEQSYKGQLIKAGTKIRMGSTIDLVLGDGIGDKEFGVPGIIGMTFAEAKEEIEASGLSFLSIRAPGVKDTQNAYIIWQRPERFDDEGHRLMIRSGQTIDIELSEGKPDLDSLQKAAAKRKMKEKQEKED